MFIDDITIRVRAGNGGKGKVAFNKNLHQYGPAGGSGGKGGSVYIEGSSNLNILNKFAFKKEFVAKNGEDGRKQFCDGSDADDLILQVPIGTVVHDLTNDFEDEMTVVGSRLLVAKGGRGGKGNFHFRSSTNTTPTEFEEGVPGAHAQLRLELKLIADVGLIGLPNAGKSSLLNELTNAESKVAGYAFTTLEPNLGAYYELIIADIPGLIEGASEGRGLGIKFLRHIERTKVFFHLISAESKNLADDYMTIRRELGAYNEDLLEKKEYVLLSKTDTTTSAEMKKKLAELKKINSRMVTFSIHDLASIRRIEKVLRELLKDKLGDGTALTDTLVDTDE